METLIIIVAVASVAITAIAVILVRRRPDESPDTERLLAQALTQLLANHGIQAVQSGNRAVVSPSGFALSGSIGRILPKPQALIVHWTSALIQRTAS